MSAARMWTTLLATALCVLSPCVLAEVKDSAADGFTIENAGWVPQAPLDVWQALTHEVGRWWPADHTWWGDATKLSIEAKAGGCFCEIDGDRQALHMTVVFVDPGKLLRMTGGLGPLQGMGLQGVMEWRLAAENDGTSVTLFYRAGGYAPDDLAAFAPVVDKVQAVQLGGLVDLLKARAANPD